MTPDGSCGAPSFLRNVVSRSLLKLFETGEIALLMSPRGLERYRHRRDPARTPEPFGAPMSRAAVAYRFVVQQHAARRMHWDFRLEIDGVLVSAYNITTAEAAALMERSRKIAGEKELIVAIQAHYPEIPSSDEWRSKVQLCMDQGATGLNFYNYGISTMSQLRGVGAVLAG